MRIQLIVFSIGLIIGSCAERFEFDEKPTPLTVIDAKVSTNPDESRIIVYEVDENGRRFHQSGYNFTITNGDGISFNFQESESLDGVIYTSPGFVGVEGQFYQLEGTSPEGFTITASDSLPPALLFTVDIADTTFIQVAGENTLQEVEGYSLNVEIDATNQESLYARYTFKYDYFGYFTGRLNTIKVNDDFTLFNCENDCSVLRQSLQLLEDRDWLFVVSPCSDPLPPPDNSVCAAVFDDYETTFRFKGQYISRENHQYWRDVERLLSNDGLVFDVFPFPIQGNIQCDECSENFVGHFQTVSEVNQEFIFLL